MKTLSVVEIVTLGVVFLLACGAVGIAVYSLVEQLDANVALSINIIPVENHTSPVLVVCSVGDDDDDGAPPVVFCGTGSNLKFSSNQSYEFRSGSRDSRDGTVQPNCFTGGLPAGLITLHPLDNTCYTVIDPGHLIFPSAPPHYFTMEMIGRGVFLQLYNDSVVALANQPRDGSVVGIQDNYISFGETVVLQLTESRFTPLDSPLETRFSWKAIGALPTYDEQFVNAVHNQTEKLVVFWRDNSVEERIQYRPLNPLGLASVLIGIICIMLENGAAFLFTILKERAADLETARRANEMK